MSLIKGISLEKRPFRVKPRLKLVSAHSNETSVHSSSIKRPSVRQQQRPSTEQSSKRQDVDILVQRMHNLVQSGSILEIDNARSFLNELLLIIAENDLTTEELTITSTAVGTVLIKSPLTSSDVCFPAIVQCLSLSILEKQQFLSLSEICLLIWFYGCFGPQMLNYSTLSIGKKAVNCLMARIEADGVQSVKDGVRLFWGLQRMRYHLHSRVTYRTIKQLCYLLIHGPTPSTSDIASLVLSAAKLRVVEGLQFFKSASRAAKKRFAEFTDESLKDFITGFAIYDFRKTPKMFDKFCDEVKLRRDDMEVSTLIKIVLSLSKLAYMPDEILLVELAEKIVKNTDILDSTDISNSFQAFSQLNMHSPKVLNKLFEHFLTYSNDYSMAQMCLLLSSYARLGQLDDVALSLGLKRIKKRLPEGIFQTDKLLLHQTLTYASLFLNMAIDDEMLPLEWQKSCQKEWENSQNFPICKEYSVVLSTARLLGLKVNQEITPKGHIMIYYVKSLDGKEKIVLDLLLHVHSFLNRSNVVIPWKQWQHRILEQQGYRVVALREQEWNQVPPQKRVRHLARKLNLWTAEEIEEIEISLGILQRRKT